MDAIPQRWETQIDKILLRGMTANGDIVWPLPVCYNGKKIFISRIHAYMPQ